ncbi:MAG TPA: hypothetical protein VME66_06175 [Candidatus Acidoferrales bacterium]|nr:hypothetical protein [Candidatus Acidoferrales bacterium]
MNISGRDLVKRTDDFEARAAGHELRPWQWDFVYAVDGRTTLGEVARKLGIEMPLAIELVVWLNEQGLTTVRKVSFEEYRRVKNAQSAFTPKEEPSANGVPGHADKPAPTPPPAPSKNAGSIGFKIK